MGRIFKNITWVFSGNVVAALTKWLILILIARLMTPEDVGVYSLAFALTAPIAIFINFKLRSLVVTDIELNFKNYVVTRNILSFVAILLILCIAFAFYPDYALIILLVGFNKILDLYSELYYSIPQLNSNFNVIGKLMIVKHAILILPFIISLYSFRSLVIAQLILVTIQFVFFYFGEKKWIENKYKLRSTYTNFKEVKNIILLGIPLGISLMLVSLNSNIPRYILEYFESAEVLGYFAAVAYVVAIGNLVMSSVSQNFLPLLSKKINEGLIKEFIKYVFGYITVLSVVLGVLAVTLSYLLGELILNLVYGQEYVAFSDILVLISISMGFNFISWGYDTALMSMRYIKIQPIISLVTAIVALMIGYFLIKNYGIYGAAYTLIITNIIQLVLRVFFVIYGIRTRLISSVYYNEKSNL